MEEYVYGNDTGGKVIAGAAEYGEIITVNIVTRKAAADGGPLRRWDTPAGFVLPDVHLQPEEAEALAYHLLSLARTGRDVERQLDKHNEGEPCEYCQTGWPEQDTGCAYYTDIPDAVVFEDDDE